MSQKLLEQHSKKLDDFQSWIEAKPHLPQNIREFFNCYVS